MITTQVLPTRPLNPMHIHDTPVQLLTYHIHHQQDQDPISACSH